jgi:NAD(P)-dependent dehydrogenase (short-subunit alcohol dehydrogenase family)
LRQGVVDVQTAVVVGAGPGLGLSIARRFGRQGMRVALISRKRDKLEGLAQQLRTENIDARGFVGDVSEETSIGAALAQVEAEYGPIEVMEFSPLPTMGRDQNLMSALGTTPEMVERQYRRLALGAVACVRQVLPPMLARKRGAILLTTSGSGYYPIQILTPIGMAMAATRQYALCLAQALAGTGVYVGTVCIAIVIRKGDPRGDPDTIAATYHELYTKRDRTEVVLAPESGSAQDEHLQDLLARGICPVLGKQARIR